MRPLAPALCILALAVCHGAKARDVTGLLNPPKAYQGDVGAPVAFVDPEKVPQFCGSVKLVQGHTVYDRECVTPSGVAILPNPCRWPNRSDYQQLACHMLGHLDGWPADHSEERR